MAWKLKIKDRFCAAHFLRNYNGACENLHGHNWIVEVEVEGEKLEENGILIDFKVLKKILSEVLNTIDHTLLNDKTEFKDENPSSENIAKFIYLNIKNKLPQNIKLNSVTVWESEDACATYFEK